MVKQTLLLLVAVAMLAGTVPGCDLLKPSADAKALKAVKEALSGKPGWQVEDLKIEVANLQVTVSGEVGSYVIAGQITQELQKLVDADVIKGFTNNCTVVDVTNPLMQDYTVPSLAF